LGPGAERAAVLRAIITELRQIPSTPQSSD